MRWLLAAGAGALALLVGSRRASASERAREAPPTRDGGRLTLRTTAYWPFTATEAERVREGGVHGAALWRGKKVVDPATGKRPELHTLEDAISGKAPYASLSGDPDVWPVGQRIEIDAWPGIAFRVVDTGGNFKGAGKRQRTEGAEPIDVCVESKRTKVPELTGARIVKGDNWEGGTPVAAANIKGQNVTVTGYQILGGAIEPLVDCVERGEAFARTGIPYTEADCAALARAIESSCPDGTVEEKQAVGWVCRNRAAILGAPLSEVVAPGGYGPRGEGRDFVSTAVPPGDVSLQVAKTVLLLRDDEDPTDGAFDFWNPGQQDEAKLLHDVQALLVGVDTDDQIRSSEEIREFLLGCGLRVVGHVGKLELLKT